MYIKMSNIAKNRVKSAWTPLTDEETNSKLFEERKYLVGKWFEKWSYKQRTVVLTALVKQCTQKQLKYIDQCVEEQLPTKQEDFTRVLPRVITLYIFSYLDPRSLCRCAQVCWYWKQLSEMDQVWLPKCVRFGWYLPHLPTPFETTVWKRHYVDKIQTLRLFRAEELKSPDLELEKLNLDKKQKELWKISNTTATKTQKPWKSADPHPKDNIRYNYLENNEFYTKGCQDDFYKKTSRPNNSAREKQLVNTAYTIKYNQKNKSMSKLNITENLTPSTKLDFSSRNRMVHTMPLMACTAVSNTNITPNSIEPPLPVIGTNNTGKAYSIRTPRDPPSTSLFPSQPWKLAVDNTDSDS